MLKITIKEAPRTKKNSQQLFFIPDQNGALWHKEKHRYVRAMIAPSKPYKDYERACSKYMPKLSTPIGTAVNVCALYYMPTRRRVDLCNLHEALCDILVHYKVIEDDNSKIIVSMDGSRVLYDKENPRTEVYITEIKDGEL